MKKISLIVPCYNEEDNVVPFYKEIIKVFKQLQDCDFELMFVNYGSKDNTLSRIKELNEIDNRVRLVSFSRNFGKEAALFAGVRNITGDCAVILDADLQHPPAVIWEMYQKWIEGFDVVEGIKTDRGKESFIHKALTKIFYGMISKAVGMNMNNSSDYKLLDKKVYTELANLKERNTFFRALSFWVGFKKTIVYYEVNERHNGTSKWSTKSLIKYAINNMICFTYSPLYIITSFGIIFVAIGLILLIYGLFTSFSTTISQNIQLIPIILFLGLGFLMISNGIIGIYLANIYDEIKGRPQYIIDYKI